MRNISLNNAGFTFIETIITFGVVGIFLLLTWGTVQFLLLQSNQQLVRTRGHFLAVEGIEIMKQIRQTTVNRNRETGFLEAFADKNGNYIIEAKDEDFLLKPGEFEHIEMDDEPFIDYCRRIEISGETPDIKLVRSLVRWGGVDCESGDHMLVYSTYLTSLKK